jgi:hypothetical protein
MHKKTIKKSKLSLTAETIRQLGEVDLKNIVGGVTGTCLGTECTCAPTYGPDCQTVGWTNCICTVTCQRC